MKKLTGMFSIFEDELKLVAKLQERAQESLDWNDFENFWSKTVAEFYDGRGLGRKESRQTTVYQIAQDLSARLAVAAGLARFADYRDELETIIWKRFKTRRAFCEATGLSEDMLSHVLAHRKHLSMETLTQILDRIGGVLRIVPRFPKGDRNQKRNGSSLSDSAATQKT